MSLILFLVHKNQGLKSFVLIGIIIFSIGIYLNKIANSDISLLSIFEQKIQLALKATFQNGRFTTAFLYIPLGMIIFNFKGSKKSGLALIFFGILFTLSLSDNLIYKLSTILTAAGLFIFSINTTLKDSKYFIYFRNSSISMYFVHMMVFSIYELIIAGKLLPPMYGFTSFAVVTVISLILSVCFIKFKNLKRT